MSAQSLPITASAAAPVLPAAPDKDAKLRAAAQSLEAAFLSEMLSFAGLDKSRQGFGGGIGEEQFSSFLRQAEATAMVKHGGIGLSEKLFEALKEHSNGHK
ncbi:MAG: chemotaxis protein chel [Paracoccaceae bacterium]|nr:chemotaxis protein chel [Paracoccaceae bacterium]